jgi:hypothetical protein
LEQLADDFPEDFFKMKILPEIMKSVEFGGGGPKAMNMVLKISAKLSSDDFETKVQPFIVRQFGNPDRALRVSLLDGLPLMIDRLPQKVVNDKIFPQMVRPAALFALGSISSADYQSRSLASPMLLLSYESKPLNLSWSLFPSYQTAP